MIDNIQNGSFHKLRFHDRRDHFYKRLSRENNCALRNRINTAGKTEVRKIIQKILIKDMKACQIFDILRRKMKFLNITDQLLKPRRDRIAAAVRITAVKRIEDNGLIPVNIAEIPLHHGEFI